MTRLKMESLAFSEMPLNRVSGKRKQADWLVKKQNDPKSIFIPIWRGCYLFSREELIQLSHEFVTEQSLCMVSMETLFLGLDNQQAFFILELSSFNPLYSGIVIILITFSYIL